MSTLAQLRSELLKDPEFADIYEAGEPDFEARKLIVAARIQEGLTQKELAERSGVKPSSLNRVERGKTSPTLAMLTKLAHGMGKRLELRIV